MASTEPPAGGEHHLHRRFGLLQSTALNMSNMVGAGPFITIPLLMSAMGGPQALLGWLVAVIICLPDGMIWSELASRMPGSGGSYVYLRDGFGRERWGRLMAFLFIWQFIISGPLEIASGYIGFAGYFRYLWQDLSNNQVMLIAAGVGVLNIFLLYRRISFISRLTVTLWVGMLFTIGAVIFTGALNFNAAIAFDFPPDAFALSWGFMWGLGQAARVGIYDYLGYYDACYIGEEVRHPARTIPRSILISLVAVASIYVLMNLSIIGVVSWRDFVPAVDHPESGYIVSIMMERVWGASFAQIFTVMILWTTFASVFALLLGYSRIPFAAARDGYFFRAFAALHPKGDFPHRALLVVGSISIAACFLSLQTVIDTLLTTRIAIQFVGQIGAVALLRKANPDNPAPYRIWFYPLPCFVALAGWCFVLFTAGSHVLLFSLLALLFGGSVFVLWSDATQGWPFGGARTLALKLLRAAAFAVIAILLAIAAFYAAYAYSTRVVEVAVPAQSPNPSRGALKHAEQYGDFPVFALRGMLSLASLPEAPAITTGMTLYRVEYWTQHKDGTPTVASGLVAMPDAGTARGVVSYQHGTNTYRHGAPSSPGIGEGAFVSAVFAGGGYIVTAPDYIGLGTNTDTHPYLVAESTANAVVDLLRAAQALTAHLGRKWPAALYLTGFSQGGHATLATQRALEALGDPDLHVVASAPIAGPYDLANISFPRALGGASDSDPLYLAYMSIAYAHAYGQPLSSLLIEPYATTLPILLDGEHDSEEIAAGLPSKPREMFSPVFLSDFDAGRPTWLLSALAQNEVFQWTPKAPVHLYYGESDNDVSPRESEHAYQELLQRGAAVTLISVGPHDHNQTILHAAPKVRVWFDEVSAK